MAINLQKGQKISLSKEAGGATLTKIVMGLGWDAKKTKGFFGMGSKDQEIDLDASCVLFDEARQPLDAIFFGQLASRDGSIQHTGDNRTGAGDGDDEQIIVDLSRVPSTVKSIMFLVNSFTGQNFSQIENAFCRVVNGANGQELARYDLTCNGAHTAMLMAKVYLHSGEWKMHAIGENATGRTFQDMMPAMQAAL
ncbi:MAG: Tellurium resistance protein terZ [Verrucomicrobiia bacterium Tous-C4TDCM]|nr:MAG: Tellurium resistance protein terZ [Verrucomicrobiae bacterium Tous-C4TDCM]